jgi:hypothetical protein
MNEVSIIINGVRYDVSVADIHKECCTCDLCSICDRVAGFTEVCTEFVDVGYNFKKSTKTFEK